MKSLMEKWFENLLQQNIIESFNTPVGEYYRLKPCDFYIPDTIVQILKKEYHPGLEKGGYFLALPEKKNNSVLFVIKEIRFVKNIASLPSEQYKKDVTESEAAITYALNNDLVPFFFHSHPTQSPNILGEAFMYNRQLDTSSPDKLLSLFSGISIGKLMLRLPDILVVVNGRLKADTFIGFYGGLVAPIGFEERKQILKDSLSDKVSDSFENLLQTPGKRLFGVLAVSAFIFLLIKYPKATLTGILTAASIMPSIAYTSPAINEFLGVAHSFSLQISLPKVSNEATLKDEQILNDLLAEHKKKFFGKAA
jgi:hypothetical protein